MTLPATPTSPTICLLAYSNKGKSGGMCGSEHPPRGTIKEADTTCQPCLVVVDLRRGYSAEDLIA